MDPEEYNKLFDYIVNKQYPKDTSLSEKRRIRKLVQKFLVNDNEMYYVEKDKISGELMQRLVVTKDKMTSILKMCHDSSGHQGVNKTVNKITERYYWKGIVSDTRSYVQFCETCQKQKKKAKTSVPELRCVPVGQRIWGKIGIDLIGPFLNDQKEPTSLNGYRYILTMICYLSKWPEAVPIYSKSSSEVASKLLDTIYRFGAPDEIVSDCGGEFNSKIIEMLCKEHNIKHITTSPYHPQSNGLTENFNGTIKTMLNKLVDNEPEKWDLFLNEALFGYRVGEHDSTKISPFEAMYCRKPVLPNQSEIGPTVQQTKLTSQMFEDLIEKRKVIENKIRENVHTAQRRQKANYDKRHNVDNVVYEVGQKVLLKNFRRKAGVGTVQQVRYNGPFEVHKYCGKGNFQLIDDGKIMGPYNQKNLKKWNEPLEKDENNNQTVCTNSCSSDFATDIDSSEIQCSNSEKNIQFVDVQVHRIYNENESEIASGQSTFRTVNDEQSSEDSLTQYFGIKPADDDSIELLESNYIEISSPTVGRKSKRAKKSTKRQSFIYEFLS